MTAPHHLSAAVQRDALHRGDISPKELVEHYLDRIERHGTDLARSSTSPRPLHGKRRQGRLRRFTPASSREGRSSAWPSRSRTCTSFRVSPLTMGSAAIDPVPPPADSWTVGLLRQAGTVTRGTTNSPEFGAPCYTDSDIVGRGDESFLDVAHPRYADGPGGAP